MAQRILSQLVAHYEDTRPREACGVVLRDGSVVRLRNWARSEDRFFTFGLKLLWILGWSGWRYGRDIAYIYHSHRQSTSPSQTDQSFMRVLQYRWPNVGHLIFTPRGEPAVYYWQED